jgi:hypothetical protein
MLSRRTGKLVLVLRRSQDCGRAGQVCFNVLTATWRIQDIRIQKRSSGYQIRKFQVKCSVQVTPLIELLYEEVCRTH